MTFREWKFDINDKISFLLDECQLKSISSLSPFIYLNGSIAILV